MATKISVIIPAFNEERHIEACLRCLSLQMLSRDEFEVIVVDNGSTDRTVALAEGFVGDLPLRIFAMPRCSISALRNYGASLATGPVLAFLDSDCLPEPNWLELGLALAAKDTLWGASYRVPTDATWVGRVWCKYQDKEQSGEVAFLPAGCLFATRSAFLALGGFDISVETSEDVELCGRARLRGMKVAANPALGVFHEGTPRALSQFYRKNRWHGKHVLRVFLANLPSTRNLPLVLLTLYTLGMFWATLIVGIMSLRHHPMLAAWPLLLLLLPSLLLATYKAGRARSVTEIPALFVLYLTYLLARAAAVTRISGSR